MMHATYVVMKGELVTCVVACAGVAFASKMMDKRTDPSSRQIVTCLFLNKNIAVTQNSVTWTWYMFVSMYIPTVYVCMISSFSFRFLPRLFSHFLLFLLPVALPSTTAGDSESESVTEHWRLLSSSWSLCHFLMLQLLLFPLKVLLIALDLLVSDSCGLTSSHRRASHLEIFLKTRIDIVINICARSFHRWGIHCSDSHFFFHLRSLSLLLDGSVPSRSSLPSTP